MRSALVFALWCAAALHGQASTSWSSSEIAVYRELLTHYPLEAGDLIGMSSMTTAFPERTAATITSRSGHVLAVPKHVPRRLPGEIVQLAGTRPVLARLKAEGKLVPASKRLRGTRADGLIRTRLHLSDIAFSADGQWAAVVFRAQCDCKGGEGGTAIFHKDASQWKLYEVIEQWIG